MSPELLAEAEKESQPTAEDSPSENAHELTPSAPVPELRGAHQLVQNQRTLQQML